MAAVSADGSTVCVLILRLNSSCRRSIALVVLALFHWLGGRRVKANSASPAAVRMKESLRPGLKSIALLPLVSARRAAFKIKYSS